MRCPGFAGNNWHLAVRLSLGANRSHAMQPKRLRSISRPLWIAAIALYFFATSAHAQQPNIAQQNFPNQNVNVGAGPGANMFGFGNNTGGNGGAESADFESLIDLITSTVATETWAETGGGEAEIRPFPTGVMVDAAGALKLVKAEAPSTLLTTKKGA